MAQALYRKYRSKSLEEVVGQPQVTDVMARSLKNGRVSHAYLLTGPRGVGKTSVARIMAHAINGLPYGDDEHLDIIEIDAASNNGVDDVRDLREKVTITPVSAAKKVYIIDEVHMLSKPAFNALLKTLEEPPEHVVFILATTEVHKLPDTILSRTQRFHFRPIKPDDMKKHLQDIAKKEKIKIAGDALDIVVERADGSFRDGISLLDQLSSLSDTEITAAMVEETLGLAPQKQLKGLIDAIVAKDLNLAVATLTSLEEGGVSPIVLSLQLSAALRTMVVAHPELIQLIDDLIEVGRSYHPELKLLAVIALASQAPNSTESSSPKVVSAATVIHSIAVAPPAAPIKELAEKEKITSPPKTTKKSGKSQPVDWPKVLEYVRTHHQPLYGILKNAAASNQPSGLNLHFTFGLHKKKLDDGTYRQLLVNSLAALYDDIPDIILTSGKLSLKNEQARAVADIMGGGEEVKVS